MVDDIIWILIQISLQIQFFEILKKILQAIFWLSCWKILWISREAKKKSWRGKKSFFPTNTGVINVNEHVNKQNQGHMSIVSCPLHPNIPIILLLCIFFY